MKRRRYLIVLLDIQVSCLHPQMDTINRLLKKQAPKRRRKADIEADRIAEEGEDGEAYVVKAPALYVRYIQNAEGSILAVPEEWLDAPCGQMLSEAIPAGRGRPFTGRMVEEVS